MAHVDQLKKHQVTLRSKRNEAAALEGGIKVTQEQLKKHYKVNSLEEAKVLLREKGNRKMKLAAEYDAAIKKVEDLYAEISK